MPPSWLFFGSLAVIGLFLINTGFLLLVKESTSKLDFGLKSMPITPHSVLLVLLIMPFLEELIFRKFIAEQLESSHGFYWALLISSFLFAISHLTGDTGTFPAFLGGIIFGYIFLRNSSLLLSVSLHSLYNLLNLIFYI